MIDAIIGSVVNVLPHLILGVFLFLVFFIAGRFLAKILLRVTAKSQPDNRQIFNLLSRITNGIFITLGLNYN
jgi:Kef-type K+ transport system membrane component KefB